VNKQGDRVVKQMTEYVLQIGIGPDVSIGSGATVVIDGSTFSNPAKSSSSGTSSSSTTAGAAASSIRSGILSSLSANTASNSANAASIRSGIESSLSAATATPSIQIDGAEPMALTFNALMAFMAAVITGAFLV
jgi:hypothetical protein